jgi:hypothetical protein
VGSSNHKASMDGMVERFQKMGGMTPELSKKIGF